MFCLLGRHLYSSTTSLRCGLGLVSKVCCTHQSPLTSTVKMEVMWAKTARSYAQATVFYTPGKMWKRERHTHNIQLCGLWKNNFEMMGSLRRWGVLKVGLPWKLGPLECMGLSDVGSLHWGRFHVAFWSFGPLMLQGSLGSCCPLDDGVPWTFGVPLILSFFECWKHWCSSH